MKKNTLSDPIIVFSIKTDLLSLADKKQCLFFFFYINSHVLCSLECESSVLWRGRTRR